MKSRPEDLVLIHLCSLIFHHSHKPCAVFRGKSLQSSAPFLICTCCFICRKCLAFCSSPGVLHLPRHPSPFLQVSSLSSPSELYSPTLCCPGHLSQSLPPASHVCVQVLLLPCEAESYAMDICILGMVHSAWHSAC
jgi:hypothetical protein